MQLPGGHRDRAAIDLDPDPIGIRGEVVVPGRVPPPPSNHATGVPRRAPVLAPTVFRQLGTGGDVDDDVECIGCVRVSYSAAIEHVGGFASSQQRFAVLVLAAFRSERGAARGRLPAD
jgi:hypothetical protein